MGSIQITFDIPFDDDETESRIMQIVLDSQLRTMSNTWRISKHSRTRLVYGATRGALQNVVDDEDL